MFTTDSFGGLSFYLPRVIPVDVSDVLDTISKRAKVQEVTEQFLSKKEGDIALAKLFQIIVTEQEKTPEVALSYWRDALKPLLQRKKSDGKLSKEANKIFTETCNTLQQESSHDTKKVSPLGKQKHEETSQQNDITTRGNGVVTKVISWLFPEKIFTFQKVPKEIIATIASFIPVKQLTTFILVEKAVWHAFKEIMQQHPAAGNCFMSFYKENMDIVTERCKRFGQDVVLKEALNSWRISYSSYSQNIDARLQFRADNFIGLNSLDLLRSPAKTDTLLQIASKFTELTSVKFKLTGTVAQQDLKMLVQNCKKLMHIEAENLDEEGIMTITNNFPNLSSLSLPYSKLTEKVMKVIVTRLTQLESLDMGSQYISKEALKHLIDAIRDNKLKRLQCIACGSTVMNQLERVAKEAGKPDLLKLNGGCNL